MPRLLLALCLLAPLTTAAQPRADEVVSWTVRSEPAARGAEARVVFTAALAPGWKMYALGSPVGRPPTVALDALPRGVEARPLRQSTPVRAFDAAFGAEAMTFSGAARLEQPLALGRRVPRGRHAVTGTLRYAVCDAEICLPPAAVPFRVTLAVP